MYIFLSLSSSCIPCYDARISGRRRGCLLLATSHGSDFTFKAELRNLSRSTEKRLAHGDFNRFEALALRQGGVCEGSQGMLGGGHEAVHYSHWYLQHIKHIKVTIEVVEVSKCY